MGYLGHGTVGHKFHREGLLGCAMEDTNVLVGPAFTVEHGVGFTSDETWGC